VRAFPRRWHFTVVGGIVGLTACLVTPANPETPDCTGMTESKSLVACHARLRRHYGAELERQLSSYGEHAAVFVEEAGDPGSGGYPRLVIWILVDRDKVDRLNDTARILEGARGVGFKTLVYVDKGEDRNWYFNLTKPGKAALDVVPWRPPLSTRRER
jgi:hypothetical protein